MKGVELFPDDETNNNFSPYYVIKEAKRKSSPAEWKELSERVFLIHSKNDKIIKFINFEDNLSLLDLPNRNVLVLTKGGHMQKKNELTLVGTTLRFLKS
jgi:hypothetical protein